MAKKVDEERTEQEVLEDTADDGGGAREGISVRRWARAISKQHELALQLLAVGELAILRRGLSAQEKIRKLQPAVDAMTEIREKLDRKVGA